MTSHLAQSIDVPRLEVAWQRNNKGSGKSPRPVKTMCNHRTLRASGLRMSSGFLGLETMNPYLDTTNTRIMQRPLQARRRRRPIRCLYLDEALRCEKFSEEAKKAMMLAQEESKRVFMAYVGTGQILLGLLGEGTGIASKVLKSMGIELEDARVQVDELVGWGPLYGYYQSRYALSYDAVDALNLSLREARDRGDYYVKSEHLLSSLLYEHEAPGARALKNMGADPTEIRHRIFKELIQVDR